MRTTTAAQKDARKKFDLSTKDREALTELVEVLEWFEWVTDEFQSNRVSISRVYPCIEFLRRKLTSSIEDFIHTKSICEHFLTSLNKRFGILIKNEVMVVSTFLDPNFVLDAFPPEKKIEVKKKIKELLIAVIRSQDPETELINHSRKMTRAESLRGDNYMFYKENVQLLLKLII